jgi:DNA modification methylase
VTPAYRDESLEVYIGDVRAVLPELEEGSVDAIVTSPPYWRQRAYLPRGHRDTALEIGREETFDGWVETMVSIADELARVMKPAGSFWINVADRYMAHGGQYAGRPDPVVSAVGVRRGPARRSLLDGYPKGVRRKSLVLAPYRLAIALCEAGWILRDRIVWEKTNALPESATDRFAVRDEVFFRFTRTRYDAFELDPVRIPAKPESLERAKRAASAGRKITSGELESRRGSVVNVDANVFRYTGRSAQRELVNPGNIWRIPTASREGASFDHFAMFPEELIVRPILSTVPAGGVVLDPFAGTGTVAAVANRLGRRAILVELDDRRLGDVMRRASTPSLEIALGVGGKA